MLWTTSSNISIITNFGCRANCWYCIWKKHELQNVNNPMDWVKLKNFLYDNRDKRKVSISGGGDCLYNYKQNADWWTKLFDITKEIGMLVDIHTREKLICDLFWKENINRCAFSSDNFLLDRNYLEYLSKVVKFRITHVVTALTTFEMIDDYLNFQKDTKCQFTIKELVGYSDNGMYNKIKNKYPNIYYLDKGDYNKYYMPDNSIRDLFLQD